VFVLAATIAIHCSHFAQTRERRIWRLRLKSDVHMLVRSRRNSPSSNGKVAVEVREFHFGKRPAVYRVIFAIEGDTVRVLRIRRAQRRALTRRQIEDALQQDD